MPPKKTVTEQTTVHILYSTDPSGTITVEIALFAPDVKKFMELYDMVTAWLEDLSLE